MLHVFLVGSGTMRTFEMNLAVESVAALQNVIERTCSIPVIKQVLLISGGTTLEPSVKVCHYAAGTDTNPIFLFTKDAVEEELKFSFSDSDSEVNMKERVDAFENMPADYPTLTARSQLAQEFAEIANNERMLCNQLVDSQHLQQQGWAAVIANLEDIINALKHNFESLEMESQQYFRSRPLYQELLQNFNEAIDLMAKVPLPPSLMTQSMGEDETNQLQNTTLLTRFCSEPRSALENMATQCTKWISRFNEETLVSLKSEAAKVLKTAEEPSMKGVKGIEERLFKLNQLLENARKCAEDQCQYAEALNFHHTRISSTNDRSVLNDLCRAHQMQLNDMLRNHLCLRDIRERCLKAKMELCKNIQRRISSWVICSQKAIVSLDNKVAVYRENLKRLMWHLDIIQQLHLAPAIYVKTLAEIRRRKSFSTSFLKWASNLSEQALELHKKEVATREAFNSQKSENFVNTLFPGMDDVPPPFATECPEPFDMLLPNISQQDLENLKKLLPEFASMMEVPLPDSMPQVSQKSLVSDSAFSSEVPSSQCAAAPSQSCASLQGVPMFRTETASGSLGAAEGGSSVAQEVPSPVSPFEDPFLPATTDIEAPSAKHARPQSGKKTDDSGVECKRLHLTEGLAEREMFSPIEEEQNNVESDGDEFERVDSVPKLFDTYTAGSETCNVKQPENVKTQNDGHETVVHVMVDSQASSSHIHADQPLASPDERLQTPDSMLTSHDFHSADCFIDDSMPSSYTESTGASALGRSPHMIKSHHVIVAELQQQLSRHNTALSDVQGSLRSRPNIMKLHGTISAFQRFVREVQECLKADLNVLRVQVSDQHSLVAEEIASVMRAMNTAVNFVRTQAEQEKMNAVDKALNEERYLSTAQQHESHQLFELEVQKLHDAHREIEIYQDQIRYCNSVLEDMKLDFDAKLQQLQLAHQVQQNELKKSMMLEQELELESVREDMKKMLQDKEDEIRSLKETVADKEAHIHMLGIAKETTEADLREKLHEEQEQWIEAMEEKYSSTQRIEMTKALEKFQYLEAKEKERMKITLDAFDTQLREQLRKEFQDEMESQKLQVEEMNKKLLAEKIDELQKKHENEIQHLKESIEKQCKREVDSMRSRFRLAYSTTSLERTSDGSLESPHAEKDCASLEREIAELQQKLKEAEQREQSLVSATEIERSNVRNELAELLFEKQRQEEHFEEEVGKLRSALQTENQTAFGKAMTNVTGEEDALKCQISFLVKKMKAVDDLLNSFQEENQWNFSDAGSELGDSKTVHSSMKEMVLSMLKRIKETIALPGDFSHLSHMDSSKALSQRIKDLEKELLKERGKNMKVHTKLKQSPESSKLSLLTCDPGDTILFCYDEKHKNYVAFSFGSVPHFLHTESLALLNLKIPPESSRMSWALGIVLHKEYCLAKKTLNRYNVPYGSRFYRVKVKPWDQKKALSHSFQPQLIFSGLSQVQSLSLCSSSSMEAAGETSKSEHMSASTI